MHFFVDIDSGHSISGWLIADNPSEVPHFIARIPSRADVTFTANVLRADLRDLGMHSSGMAGFMIDDSVVPGLRDAPDVTLIEAGTGLPFYRRFNPDWYLDKKFLLLDVGLFPQVKILRRVMTFFALSYPVIERLPIETISAVIVNKEANSIFVAGQPNWMRHNSAIQEKEYVSAALLRDPFEDLAERLLFISHLAKQPNRISANISLEKYVDILGIVSEMNFSDTKSVLSGFRKMSTEDKKLFRSPMTHVFGGSPEADLQRRNVSVALDNLAQFSVVGVRSLFSEFASMVDERLKASVLGDCELENLPGTPELAIVLSDIGLVADLLDEDIALYSFAYEAVEAGLKIAEEQQHRGGRLERAAPEDDNGNV